MRDENLDVIELSDERLDIIKPLLTTNLFKPLRFIPTLDNENLSDYWLHLISETTHARNPMRYYIQRAGHILGLLVCTENQWETDLLGKKAAVINTFVVDNSLVDNSRVARCLLEHFIKQAMGKNIEFVSSKTYTNDLISIHALESCGFQLMDTVVDCFYDYRAVPFTSISTPALDKEVSIREAVPADRDELVSVSGDAFNHHFGRFHSDERIGRCLANKAYENWICSSLDGYADWIHLALVKDRIAGFSIWKKASPNESKLKYRIGHYSIAGIHPDFQGRNLFTILTYAGMKALNGIVDVIEGPTHINNYGVQKAYSKLAWRVLSDARHTFHKWIE